MSEPVQLIEQVTDIQPILPPSQKNDWARGDRTVRLYADKHE